MITGVLNGERGTYVLIVSLDRDCLISVGKLGPIRFRSGIYAYSGSAMAGYRSRVGRHFSHDKKLRWHIDYLLEEAEPIGAFLVQGGHDIECVLSRILSSLVGSEPVIGFGSSDCSCHSHLYWIEESSIPYLIGRIGDMSQGSRVSPEND